MLFLLNLLLMEIYAPLNGCGNNTLLTWFSAAGHVAGLMWHVLLICHVRRLNANASQSESDFDLDFDFDTASHSASTQSDSKYFLPRKRTAL